MGTAPGWLPGAGPAAFTRSTNVWASGCFSRSTSAVSPPRRVVNGVVGIVSMSTASGFSDRKCRVRLKMSLVDMWLSMVTFLMPMPTSWFRRKGFRDARAFLSMRRMNSCWRLIRPRSPVGSDFQRPASYCSKCRLRTQARAWKPVRVTHPGVLI